MLDRDICYLCGKRKPCSEFSALVKIYDDCYDEIASVTELVKICDDCYDEIAEERTNSRGGVRE